MTYLQDLFVTVPKVLPTLSHTLLIILIKLGVVPDEMKTARVIPLYKSIQN